MRTAQKSGASPLFLGIDGGATRTVAILADADDRLDQRLETGPCNLRLMSDDALVARFAGLAEALPTPAAICIGLAGLRGPEDASRAVTAAARVWPGIPCETCSDLETAMAAANPGPGVSARVLVLSGTGSCCFGRRKDGSTAKVGGWGHLLGDRGSAYEIASQALKQVIRSFDRTGIWPALGGSFLRELHLNSPEELIDWAHNANKADIARLAIEVFAALERGDEIAEAVLASAATELATDAASCARRLGALRQPVEFIFSGSVLVKQPRFAKLVTRHLKRLWPRAEVIVSDREPAWGAVRLAIQEWKTAEQSRDPKARTFRVSGHDGASAPVSEPGPSPTSSVAIPDSTALSPTERRNPRSVNFNRLSLNESIGLMLSEESEVPGILLKHRETIATCIKCIVRAFRGGGRLFYVGAGTSGRIGTLDASECPPTFRVAAEQVQAIMAGGQQALWTSIEGAEDDSQAGVEAVRFRGVRVADVVVGIAASGRTPFVWGALEEARRRGATTILICFNPFLKLDARRRPDIVLAPDLGPEVLTGSTRLKAGTATKLLLNLFTTVSMARLGKVVSNLMVDLNPSNQKLRQRAVRIVRELTGASAAEAEAQLERSDWVVKSALRRLGYRKAGAP